MEKKWPNIGIWLVFIIFGVTNGALHGQNADVVLYLEINPQLTSSELVDLSKMATGERVPSRRLLLVNLRNNSNERLNNLFFDVTFNSNEGVLWEVNQRNSSPFYLRGRQSVFATNNDFVDGRITGVPGDVDINFDGRLTETGRSVLNRLRNNTGSPHLEFTIEIGVYKDNNRQNGGIQIAGSTVALQIESSDRLSDINFIALTAPGNHMESRPPVNISNPYPEFRWEGPQNETYRVVVVERKPGQNPETLIKSAMDTPSGGIGESVDLLDFETSDVKVERTGFQYPSFGVVPLQTGKQYFWQVFTENGKKMASEIWSFRLTGGDGGRPADAGNNGEVLKMEDEQLREILAELLGMNVVRELERGNYELLDIELKGVQYTGERAMNELLRLIEQIRMNEVKVNKNRRP